MKRLPTLILITLLMGLSGRAHAQRVVVDTDRESVIILRADGSADTLEVSNHQPLILMPGDSRAQARQDRNSALRVRAQMADTTQVMIADNAPLFRSPSDLTDQELHEEIAKAEHSIRDLVNERRTALSEGRIGPAGRLEQFIRQGLEEAFDLRQEARRRSADASRMEAERQMELLEERQQNLDLIIERRFDELTRDRSRSLDW